MSTRGGFILEKTTLKKKTKKCKPKSTSTTKSNQESKINAKQTSATKKALAKQAGLSGALFVRVHFLAHFLGGSTFWCTFGRFLFAVFSPKSKNTKQQRQKCDQKCNRKCARKWTLPKRAPESPVECRILRDLFVLFVPFLVTLYFFAFLVALCFASDCFLLHFVLLSWLLLCFASAFLVCTSVAFVLLLFFKMINF